jgi:hypothetical protein
MSEQIQKLITLLKDPNHMYIYNHIQDIKDLIDKIEKDKKKPFMDMEPVGTPWNEQRQFESDD